jgi:hypothetical protein
VIIVLKKTITVIERNKPAISSVDVNESTVTINLAQMKITMNFLLMVLTTKKRMYLYNVPEDYKQLT